METALLLRHADASMQSDLDSSLQATQPRSYTAILPDCHPAATSNIPNNARVPRLTLQQLIPNRADTATQLHSHTARLPHSHPAATSNTQNNARIRTLILPQIILSHADPAHNADPDCIKHQDAPNQAESNVQVGRLDWTLCRRPSVHWSFDQVMLNRRGSWNKTQNEGDNRG